MSEYILNPYDDGLRKILKEGKKHKNRTGIDTLRVLSLKCEYEIGERFPLVTKRKLFPRSIFSELLWMLSGSTDNKELVRTGCKFWTPWVDKSHEENRKFYERTGFPDDYLGPIYGWQMRHFGGDYRGYLKWLDDKEHVFNWGTDQISWLLREIEDNPNSRRLIVSMWNPTDMHIMRLPPCHFCFQILIEEDRMSLVMSQRSADFAVGVPANICFYSALCCMLAQQTGYVPHKFIHETEDCHIYVDQVKHVEEYLSRAEVPSPFLKIKKAKDLFSYKVDDFELSVYNPHPAIRMPVAV